VIVVASANGRIGIEDAIAALRRGGSALDAVEAGIRPVERNPEDHSVGYGGLPNLLGEVELDASIMDGATRAAGAVGALKGYTHAITLARRVMEQLPHVFLVGEGAVRFAAEMGMAPEDLLTEAARETWEERLRAAQERADEAPAESGLERYYAAVAEMAARVAPGTLGAIGATRPPDSAADAGAAERLAAKAHLAADPEQPNETVNFIAQDRQGHIACGVSTSGWAWKYPGRIGDSPIIGAGNYADDRFGAAACTGRGEMAIRACTAYAVVAALRAGLEVEEACRAAMDDTLSLEDVYAGQFSLIALGRHGNPAAASNHPGATYLVMTPDLAEPEERPRIVATRAAG
jgi:beta-aspartyl-peptidase (threonine type)